MQPLSKALDAGVYRTQPQILSVPVALVRAAALSCAPATKRGMLGCCSISTTILTALRHLEKKASRTRNANHSDEDAVFIGAFVPASNPLSGLPDNCLVMGDRRAAGSMWQ